MSEPSITTVTDPGSRSSGPGTETVGAGARPDFLNVRLWPWWVQIGAMYLAARLVSFLIFHGSALKQGASPWGPAQPDYWKFLTIWDSQWYLRVAQNGYPSVLPVDANGNVTENTWAFYPLFPFLGRWLGQLTGTSPTPWLIAIAMVAGLGAALVIYRLFREFAGHSAAFWGTTFVSTFPVAAILQVPYAESLNLLLLATTFLFAVRGRYLLAVPFALLAVYSRPVGVPLGAALGIFFLVRAIEFMRARRRGETPELKPVASLGALAVLTCAGALSWPVIAGLVTGVPDAYTRTETVWRGGGLVVFLPWVDMTTGLLGPLLGSLSFVALVVGVGLVLVLTPAVRKIGLLLQLWCGAYILYLLAFLHPQTSTFRMLLPLFPLALAAALGSKSRAYRWTVVIMFTLLQIVWVYWLWVWAQLPGGGDYPP